MNKTSNNNRLSELIKINKSLEIYGFMKDMTIEETKSYIENLNFAIPNTKASKDLDAILKLFEDQYKIKTPYAYYHTKPYPFNVYFECFIPTNDLDRIKYYYKKDTLNEFLCIYESLLSNLLEKYQVCIKMRYAENAKIKDIAIHENVSSDRIHQRLEKSIRILHSRYIQHYHPDITSILKEEFVNNYSSIDILNLSRRSYNALTKRGITNLTILHEVYVIEIRYNVSIINKFRNMGVKSSNEVKEKLESFLSQNDSVRGELLLHEAGFIKTLNDEYLDYIISKMVFSNSESLYSNFTEKYVNMNAHISDIIESAIFNSYALKDFTDAIRTRPYKDMSIMTILSVYEYFDSLNKEEIVEDHIKVIYESGGRTTSYTITYEDNKVFCEKYLLNKIISKESMDLIKALELKEKKMNEGRIK